MLKCHVLRRRPELGQADCGQCEQGVDEHGAADQMQFHVRSHRVGRMPNMGRCVTAVLVQPISQVLDFRSFFDARPRKPRGEQSAGRRRRRSRGSAGRAGQRARPRRTAERHRSQAGRDARCVHACQGRSGQHPPPCPGRCEQGPQVRHRKLRRGHGACPRQPRDGVESRSADGRIDQGRRRDDPEAAHRRVREEPPRRSDAAAGRQARPEQAPGRGRGAVRPGSEHRGGRAAEGLHDRRPPAAPGHRDRRRTEINVAQKLNKLLKRSDISQYSTHLKT
ncbi:hypothetical protein Lal_00014796 [Lupinus albus]|nr:hypothetical protein Lal_00014796 [Lupinus albus]